MTHSGDFSKEAYEQLQQAYANQLTTQDEQELAGHEVLGQKMTLETLPVDSPWRDKITDWQYPNGKSAFMDGKQSPEEILEIMRQSVTDRQAKAEAEDTMSDEELDEILDEILGEEDDEEETEEEETEEEDEEEEVGEADEAEESYEVEEEEEEEYEDEEEEEEEEYEDEEEEEEEEDLDDETADPEEVAEQIAALKEQIEAFRFTTEQPEDDDE